MFTVALRFLLQFLNCVLGIVLLTGCGQSKYEATKSEFPDTIMPINSTAANQDSEIGFKKNPTDFLPKDAVVFEKIFGDLNNDGTKDCVLIIKGTDQNQITNDEIRGPLDRNRRGILILFYKNGLYELVVKNDLCFSSENEDGGVYFPPELSIEIKNCKLFVHYAHGRYGYWEYNFRYQNSDFELIGYVSSEGGAVINSETSINFLTKKKQVKINVNEHAEGGDEVFEETWKNISLNKPILISEIKNFDELDMTVY